MTVGRKPKPTHLRILDGNAGRRPLNDQEPVPVGDLLEPPEWMTETQKDGWRYAIANAPLGLLKYLDRSVLVVWVVAEDVHREAALKVAEYGAVIKSPTGLPMQSPYLAVMNKQAAIMMKAAAEMGFTPSSRSRVRVGEAPRATNRFAGLREIGDD
jgi:P27 family predicted phage terminase small subunit